MQYQIDASRTEAPIDADMIARSANPDFIRLEHAAYGLAGEVGELIDALKKHKFYGKDLDFTNLLEEGGDLLWYVALLCNALNVDMQLVMDKNISKLKARFPDKYNQHDVLNRDLDAERKVLEAV